MPIALHVYHIESPSPYDFLENLTEATVPMALRTSGFPMSSMYVTDEVTLEDAIVTAAADALTNHVTCPVIHLSCHGADHGVQLTNQGEVIKWTRLADILRAAKELCGHLALCMTSCEGGSGVEMYNEVPLDWFIGCPERVAVGKGASAFLPFYLNLRNNPVRECIRMTEEAARFKFVVSPIDDGPNVLHLPPPNSSRNTVKEGDRVHLENFCRPHAREYLVESVIEEQVTLRQQAVTTHTGPLPSPVRRKTLPGQVLRRVAASAIPQKSILDRIDEQIRMLKELREVVARSERHAE